MKKFKLFAPILALSATAATVIPMVGCTTNPSNVFDVTISDEVHEHVTLEKTKAEKGKRFETKVTLDTPFYMNKVTVMVGDKQLVEGDIDASDNFQFFYDYINNKLTIKEDVIDANVVLNFEFTYVFSDTVSYVPGHIPYLVSNHDINIQDTSKIYTFYLYMDFTGWPSYYVDLFPQYFCFSRNPDIESNATFVSVPEILSITTLDIDVTLIDYKDVNDKCFKLSGDDYGYGKDLKLLMYMQCKFDTSPSHYRFYGYHHDN